MKRYVRRLAPIFAETWEVFAGGVPNEDVSDIMAVKKWLAIPNIEGANTVSKLRDFGTGQ